MIRLTRRRFLESTVGALLLIVAAMLAVVNSGRSVALPKPVPSPSTTTAPLPTLSTLLVEIRGDDSIGVADLLTAVGGVGDSASWMTVDPRLEVSPPGHPAIALGHAGVELGTLGAVGSAFSDLVGVRVDGTWVLGRLTLAGLIDAVGGIQVTVPARTVLVPANGSLKIVLPPGPTHLEGATAALYATTLATDGSTTALVSRASDVLTQLVMSLPVDADRIRLIIASLGAFSQSTLSGGQLSAYLAHLRTDLVSNAVQRVQLPTEALTYTKSLVQLAIYQSADLMAKLVPMALRRPGEGQQVRVIVQSALGTPDLTSGIADRLVNANLTYVDGRQAAVLGVVASQILVPDNSPTSLGWGNTVANALGLPFWDVHSAGHQIVGGDVLAIIGTDYHP